MLKRLAGMFLACGVLGRAADSGAVAIREAVGVRGSKVRGLPHPKQDKRGDRPIEMAERREAAQSLTGFDTFWPTIPAVGRTRNGQVPRNRLGPRRTRRCFAHAGLQTSPARCRSDRSLLENPEIITRPAKPRERRSSDRSPDARSLRPFSSSPLVTSASAALRCPTCTGTSRVRPFSITNTFHTWPTRKRALAGSFKTLGLSQITMRASTR